MLYHDGPPQPGIDIDPASRCAPQLPPIHDTLNHLPTLMQPSSSTQPAASQRNASGSSTAKERRRTSRATSGGDKKKRQRVTSDQLAHLESIFAVEHTPTQERRRQISQALGMEEKQTKVWFQNRCECSALQTAPCLRVLDGQK